jgi:hypothetical protein
MIDSFPCPSKDAERVSEWKENTGWRSETTDSKG